jgi:hypothetical protein
MSFYDLVDLVVEDLKAQARIDAVVKELVLAQQHSDRPAVVHLRIDNAIALLKEGVGKC